MRSLFLLFVFFNLALSHHRAMAQMHFQHVAGQWAFSQNDEGFIEVSKHLQSSENPRLVAIALDITLGLFGMHRLYLGTNVKVPVAYTLTFGGGGVLWLVDLALLIGSPNIESYKNNPHLFMWIPPANTAP
jgi:TM2 domain-containing membrane protein YozV